MIVGETDMPAMSISLASQLLVLAQMDRLDADLLLNSVLLVTDTTSDTSEPRRCTEFRPNRQVGLGMYATPLAFCDVVMGSVSCDFVA